MTFRRRLFLGTALALVAVLAAAAAFAVHRILLLEAGRLDQRLCLEARRLADGPAAEDESPLLARDLMAKLQVAAADDVVFWFWPRREGEGAASPRSGALPAALAWHPLSWARGSALPQCQGALLEREGSRWQLARYAGERGSAVVGARVAAAQQPMRAVIGGVLWQALPFALVLVAVVAWLMASLAVRPLERLRDSMRALSPRDLGTRLPRQGEDREFAELIDVYNGMLARLESSFQQAARFSANAAHELKTPLTILRGRLEQMLARPDPEKREADVGLMLEEIARLSAITRKLLLLSQADAGQLALHREALDLAPLLAEMGHDLELLGGARRITVQVDANLPVQVDRMLVTLLLNNLSSNALRYSPDDGWIRLAAACGAGGVQVRIANACVPLGPEVRARLFERFYRGDDAHGRRQDGHGLGLALAREIALAHGGKLELEASASNEVRFCLTLPLAASGSAPAS